MLKLLLAAWVSAGEIFWFIQNPAASLKLSPQFHTNTFKPSATSIYTGPVTSYQSYRRLARWIYPIAETDLKHAKCCAMLTLPISDEYHNWWIEPGIQEVTKPLLNRESLRLLSDAHCLRYSLGSGYRYVLTPLWMLGGYCYYDYEWGPDFPMHTINIGIENQVKGFKAIGNMYLHFVNSFYFRNDSPTLAWDCKIEQSLFFFKVGIGAYYKQVHMSSVQDISDHDSAGNRQYALPVCGGFFEFKHLHYFRTYSIRYSYDTLKERKLLLGIQWQLFEPFKDRAFNVKDNLWAPTERYLNHSKVGEAGERIMQAKGKGEAEQARLALLCFSNCELNTKEELSITISKIREMLPYELKQEILKHMIDDLLQGNGYLFTQGNHIKHTLLAEYDIVHAAYSDVHPYLYQHFLDNYSNRLLPFLINISTQEAARNYIELSDETI